MPKKRFDLYRINFENRTYEPTGYKDLSKSECRKVASKSQEVLVMAEVGINLSNCCLLQVSLCSSFSSRAAECFSAYQAPVECSK